MGVHMASGVGRYDRLGCLCYPLGGGWHAGPPGEPPGGRCSAAPRHASLAVRGEGDSPFIRAALLASLAVVCSATADWAR